MGWTAKGVRFASHVAPFCNPLDFLVTHHPLAGTGCLPFSLTLLQAGHLRPGVMAQTTFRQGARTRMGLWCPTVRVARAWCAISESAAYVACALEASIYDYLP
jgi:hypothetical protein